MENIKHKNIFIQLYLSLNKEDISELKKYILSEIFVKNELIINLYKYLFSRKYCNHNNCSSRKIFKHLFPKNDYNDLKMRHLYSEAKDVLEQFLAISNFRADTLATKKHYIQSLIRLKNHNVAQKEIFKFQNILEALPYRNASYYFENQYLIETKYILQNEIERNNTGDYYEILDNLSTQYAIQILKNTCIYLAQNQLKEHLRTLDPIKTILDTLVNDDIANLPVVKLYNSLYQLLITQQENYFFNTKEYLSHYKLLVSVQEYKEVLLMLLNFCIKKYNNNENNFGYPILELYDEGLINGVFLENNIINKFTYTNYITIALKLREPEKAFALLEKFKKNLQSDIATETYNYNYCRVLYVQKDYTKALKIINQINISDELWSLNAKILHIKILYDIGSTELLETLLINLTTLIKRKKGIGYHGQYFLKAIKSLRHLKDVNYKSKSEIKKRIENLEKHQYPEYDWVIERLLAL